VTTHYSIFEYLYRDSGNYKAWGKLLLCGIPSDDSILKLVSKLDSGIWFVAEQINIPTLYAELYQYSGGPTDEDHAFHEFSELRQATDTEIAECTPWGDVDELLARFFEVPRWQFELSPHATSYFH